jgi:thiamine biosynthesis lipoprotein
MASQFIFDAIGTHWVIDIDTLLSREAELSVLDQIKHRIDEFDKAYSRFRSDSLITRISKESGDFVLPDDARDMMDLYKRVYDITRGQVTPLIGSVLVDAGYDAQYSLMQKKELKIPPAWETVIQYVHPVLSVREPILLDFGAAGKGYLVDIVSRLLLDAGIESFCVDAGGDMVYRNTEGKQLSVGLEDPNNTSNAIGVVSILNQSICGSAGNRRVWGDFHHVIDPSTLSSPKHRSAVWVIAENAILADILTTALLFTEAEVLQQFFSFEYCILNPDYSIETSRGFQSKLSI